MKLAIVSLALAASGCSKDTAVEDALQEEWRGTLPASIQLSSLEPWSDGGYAALGYESVDGKRSLMLATRDGTITWIDALPANGPLTMAADGEGHLYVSGTISTATEFLGTTLSAASYPVKFVLKVDGDGKVLWSKLFDEGRTNNFVYDLAAGPEGVALAGTFTGGFSIDDRTLIPGQSTATVALLVRLDPEGKVLVARSYVSTAAVAASLSRASDGDLFLGGTFTGVLTLGATPMASSSGAVFLARLAPDGTARWSRHFSGRGNVDIVPWEDGAALLMRASFVDLGVGRWLTGQVAARTDVDGKVVWARQLGSLLPNGGDRQGAVDARGNLFVGRSLEKPELVDPYYPYPATDTAVAREVVVLDRDGRLGGLLEIKPISANDYPLSLEFGANPDGSVLIGTSDSKSEATNYGTSVTTVIRRLRFGGE